ncbi:uncharacterized protein LOC119586287 isoform X3 [Penaeus monodon]|uniref:uncharacterized protein LOC119586287 isoform X3 n=1 Tax=Penaeus monodon TaxID=6687 RepID=UPI0018A778E4|nr:uncharacterized protein LOC119586287 isoform X3 [Penaeus monodon]
MHAHTIFVALLALSATAHAHALPLAPENEDVIPTSYTEEELNEDEDFDDYNRYEDEREEHPLRRNHDDPSSFPATVNRDPLADARAMARLSIMDRLLIALGPPFSEKLPKAPTNDTLATVPTPINITAEPCPYKYKRCSSQTFFPSCDIPRNTDPAVWPQRFNLFFNLSTDFDNKLDVINATLRLFKNSTVPFNSPQTLLINVFAYTRSLTRRRAKTQLVADAQVSSDYIGWVSLSVDRMVRRWKKQRNNHGLLVTVTDPNQIPWDAPKLFVIMDCASGNTSLVPLPFEVQTDEEGQRYPALNVRQGSLDDESPWPEKEVAEAAAAAAAAEAAAESADTALGVELLLEVQKAVEQSSQHTLRSADEQLLQFLGNSRSRSSSRQATMEDQPDDAGSSRSRRSTAHWSKPCTNLMHVSSNTQQTLSYEILLAVAKAISYMGQFKNNFSRDVLHMDWEDLRDVHTNGITVQFIKSIPAINKTALDFDEQLQEAYEMMQRLAVGIEQVTLDQALYQGSFLQQFRIIENHIVSILCQLHYAMVHRNLSPSVSVTKEIMGEEYRDLEGESSRNMRDAVIVREYDAALMHLKEVFSEFDKETP